VIPLPSMADKAKTCRALLIRRVLMEY